MKRSLLIVIFFLPLGILAVSPSDYEVFDGEVLEYSMKFKGVNSARSVLSADVRDSLLAVRWTVDTKSVFNLLFYVHNEYKSEYNIFSGRLVTFEKEIDQKNISQQFRIDYRWPDNRAVASFGEEWHVPPVTLDVLTMIYRLRLTKDFRVGDSLFSVDVESSVSRVVVDSVGVNAVNLNGPLPAPDYVRLMFQPIGPVKKRGWKTDLLTNRIARRGGSLEIWLGPEPERFPVRLCFRSKGSAVIMDLERVKNGKTE